MLRRLDVAAREFLVRNARPQTLQCVRTIFSYNVPFRVARVCVRTQIIYRHYHIEHTLGIKAQVLQFNNTHTFILFVCFHTLNFTGLPDHIVYHFCNLLLLLF